MKYQHNKKSSSTPPVLNLIPRIPKSSCFLYPQAKAFAFLTVAFPYLLISQLILNQVRSIFQIRFYLPQLYFCLELRLISGKLTFRFLYSTRNISQSNRSLKYVAQCCIEDLPTACQTNCCKSLALHLAAPTRLVSAQLSSACNQLELAAGICSLHLAGSHFLTCCNLS